MSIRAKEVSTAEAFETMHNDLMLERRTAMPGKITHLNIDSSGALVSVNVQPLIYQVIANDNGIESDVSPLPIITRVPLVYPRAQGAGYLLSMPVSVGDDVLLIIADRAIDNWQRDGDLSAPVEPVTPRAHDITDAIAIIGLSNDVNNVPNYRFDRMEMRNLDGTVYVSLKDDEIELEVAGSTITINDLEIDIRRGTSNINMTANAIDITADTVTINGASLVLASTSIDITTSDIVSGDEGISLSDHVHTSGGAGNPTSPPL